MADNTIQFRWISVIYHNLAWLFADNPNVFVAGDLLWYPVEGKNTLRQAPDVMVAFGVAKGDRGSYQQWKEHNIAPQVVFEILSPGNMPKEMNRKLFFYNRYGVEEYYLYDPYKNALSGWIRSELWLDLIENLQGWSSPRLGIRFELTEETLMLFRPDDKPFEDYETVQQKLSEVQHQLSETSKQLDETAKQLDETSKQLEEEQARSRRLEKLLQDAGLDPEQRR